MMEFDREQQEMVNDLLKKMADQHKAEVKTAYFVGILTGLSICLGVIIVAAIVYGGV